SSSSARTCWPPPPTSGPRRPTRTPARSCRRPWPSSSTSRPRTPSSRTSSARSASSGEPDGSSLDLIGARDDDRGRPEVEAPGEGQGAVVVEDLLPPVLDDQLGDDDGDDGRRILGDELVDVVEDGPGEVAVRRVDHRQGDVEVVLGPFLPDPVGVAFL